MTKERHKIVTASYLILLQEENVLLLRRFNTGYEDGKYSLVAGHTDSAETVRDTIIREAKEEVGIRVAPEDLSLAHVMHRLKNPGSDERLDFFFSCSTWEGEITNQEPNKCDDLKWVPISDLPSNVIPYIRQAITSFCQGILYSEIV